MSIKGKIKQLFASVPNHSEKMNFADLKSVCVFSFFVSLVSLILFIIGLKNDTFLFIQFIQCVLGYITLIFGIIFLYYLLMACEKYASMKKHKSDLETENVEQHNQGDTVSVSCLKKGIKALQIVTFIVAIPAVFVAVFVEAMVNIPNRVSQNERFDYCGLWISTFVLCALFFCLFFEAAFFSSILIADYLAGLLPEECAINKTAVNYSLFFLVATLLADGSFQIAAKYELKNIPKEDRDYKRAFLESKILEIELGIFVFLFIAAIFFPNIIPEGTQADFVNVVTLCTLIMLLFDKRALWEERILQSRAENSASLDADQSACHNHQKTD